MALARFGRRRRHLRQDFNPGCGTPELDFDSNRVAYI